MRSVEEHLRLVLAGIEPLEPLELPLADALGCVLAKDVRATWPLPSFDNSSMDGYAVQSSDLAAASEAEPVRLKVGDDVPAAMAALDHRAARDVDEEGIGIHDARHLARAARAAQSPRRFGWRSRICAGISRSASRASPSR